MDIISYFKFSNGIHKINKNQFFEILGFQKIDKRNLFKLHYKYILKMSQITEHKVLTGSVKQELMEKNRQDEMKILIENVKLLSETVKQHETMFTIMIKNIEILTESNRQNKEILDKLMRMQITKKLQPIFR